MAKIFDASNPDSALSRDQVALLQKEQQRLAASTPLPVKRDQQKKAAQAVSAAATKPAASRSSRGAETMFSGKGTDDILAGDVYDIKESTNLNSVFESAKGTAKDSVNYLKTNPSSVREVLKTALDMKSGYITPTDALGRLGVGLNSGTLLKLKDGAGGLLDKVGGSLGISPDITNHIKLGLGGAVQYITTNDITGAADSFDIMRSVLGNSELLQFFDIEAETTLLSGIFDNAVEYGMYDVIDYTKTMNRYDERSFQFAVMSASSTAVYSGDIDSIEMMLKHITAEQLLGENPNVIQDILRNYTLRPDVTPDLYPTKLAQLVALLNRININWYKAPLNGEYVINYDAVSLISDDATKLFMLDAVLRDIVLVAPFYIAQSPIVMGAAMYPGSAIGVVK